MFMGLTVVAFVRAARAPQDERRWWLAGVAALALAVLSHVATGMIAVPVGLFAAALAIIPRRNMGWRRLSLAVLPLVLGLMAIAGYWLLVLLPASTDYVTNPASLAYRGPDRLLSSLTSYWPTSVAIVLGVAAIALGSLGECFAVEPTDTWCCWRGSRSFGAPLPTRCCPALRPTTRVSPRSSVAPVVIAAAGAITWLIGALARSTREMMPAVPQEAVVIGVVVLVTAISTPFAVQRFGRQAVVYQPRDATALTSAALAIEDALAGQSGAVLTDVRDGKWVEGLTGREALFSLPVRYAFRPNEWQRSVDADAVLRSTTTLTSGLVSAMYIGEREVDGNALPTDLLVRVNHGGEFVDMVRINPAAVEINTGRGQWTAANRLAPVRATRASNTRQATMTTVWQGSQPRDVAHAANPSLEGRRDRGRPRSTRQRTGCGRRLRRRPVPAGA